jgi:hypothetical protein
MDERELRALLSSIRLHTKVSAYALLLIAVCAVIGLGAFVVTR